MRNVAPETLAKIVDAIPCDAPVTTLDIWRGSGGISHQQVKNALGRLVAVGRVLRLEERAGASLRVFYRKASS